MPSILETYNAIRQRTLDICKPLKKEDYVVQPVPQVSPPKWHMGHTTWFFETLILKPYKRDYQIFNPQYNYVFNSYYESAGARIVRTDRGNLSRPSVDEIIEYRSYVNREMKLLMKEKRSEEVKTLIDLGLNHEQQHQELMLTDIKYILGHNPLFPIYSHQKLMQAEVKERKDFIATKAGVYEIGYEGEGFCYDNERGRHKVYLQDNKISTNLVTNGEYLSFIEAGGYKKFQYWHSDGWAWVQDNDIKAPLYWHKENGSWKQYTLQGLQPLDESLPVCHVSYYEAAAFAEWKGMRLPTEEEWEIASAHFQWGKRWEWTESAYLPYPGFEKEPGPAGEYNGKFMVNQKVLRGASEVTSPNHSRKTYRNFFQPYYRWQFMGIRLAHKI